MHQGEGEDLGHLQREDATRGSAQWLERAHGRGAHCAICQGSGKRVGGSKRNALRAWLSTEGRLTGVAVADVAAAAAASLFLTHPNLLQRPMVHVGPARDLSI